MSATNDKVQPICPACGNPINLMREQSIIGPPNDFYHKDCPTCPPVVPSLVAGDEVVLTDELARHGCDYPAPGTRGTVMGRRRGELITVRVGNSTRTYWAGFWRKWLGDRLEEKVLS